jgi:hypothetical protein
MASLSEFGSVALVCDGCWSARPRNIMAKNAQRYKTVKVLSTATPINGCDSRSPDRERRELARDRGRPGGARGRSGRRTRRSRAVRGVGAFTGRRPAGFGGGERASARSWSIAAWVSAAVRTASGTSSSSSSSGSAVNCMHLGFKIVLTSENERQTTLFLAVDVRCGERGRCDLSC